MQCITTVRFNVLRDGKELGPILPQRVRFNFFIKNINRNTNNNYTKFSFLFFFLNINFFITGIVNLY